MEIGGQWFTKEGWVFHAEDKNLIRKVIKGGKLGKFILLQGLKFNRKILIDEGEGSPKNYELALFIREKYLENMHMFNPSKVQKFAVPPLVDFVCGLFKEDSCYIERIGGGMQWIVDNYELFDGKTDTERIEAFKLMYQWFKTEDWRVREHEIYDEVFGVLFEKYGHDRFITLSMNYIINLIIANRHNWERDNVFNPEYWWPRGYGGINAILCGREF